MRTTHKQTNLEETMTSEITQRFQDLLNERLSKQIPMHNALPEIPLVEEVIKTFEELAIQMGQQEDFIWEKMEEIKEQFAGHYMTQMNKKLIAENKELKKETETKIQEKIQEIMMESGSE